MYGDDKPLALYFPVASFYRVCHGLQTAMDRVSVKSTASLKCRHLQVASTDAADSGGKENLQEFTESPTKNHPRPMRCQQDWKQRRCVYKPRIRLRLPSPLAVRRSGQTC